MGAKFNILTDENTHSSENADTLLSSSYSDLSDGTSTTVPLAGAPYTRYYMADVNVSSKPDFGDAKLVGLEHYLYVDSISQGDSFQAPIYRAWKSKQSIGSNEGGVVPNCTDIIVGSSQTRENNIWIEESFSGYSPSNINPIVTSTNVIHRSGLAFIYPSEAVKYNANGFAQLNEGDMWNKYGNFFQGEKVIFIEKSFYGTWEITNPRAGQSASAWLETEPRWRRRAITAAGLPHYTIEEVVELTESEKAINQTETIFDSIEAYYQDITEINSDGKESPIYHTRATYSNEQTLSNTSSMKLEAFWKNESTQSFTPPDSKNGVSNVQDLRITMDYFPRPENVSGREYYGSSVPTTAPSMDIDLYIEKLEVAYDSGDTGKDHLTGESLSRRSFAFTWGLNAPKQNESIYDYIKESTTNLTHPFMGLILARIEKTTGDTFTTPDGDGIYVFPSEEKYDGTSTEHWSIDNTNKLIEPSQSLAQMGSFLIPEKRWLRFRFLYLPTRSYGRLYVIDIEKDEEIGNVKIVNTLKQPTVWPRHFTMWLNNYKSDATADGNIDSDRETKSVVYVDNLTFYNWEANPSNSTVTKNNILTRGPIYIRGELSRTQKNKEIASPTYISLGFKDKTSATTGLDEDADTNFLFSGYQNENLAVNASVHNDNITMAWSTDQVGLGVQVDNAIFNTVSDDGIGKLAESYPIGSSSFRDRGPANAVDGFSQKGFIGLNITESAFSGHTFTETENILFSTRILKLISNTSAKVSNIGIFSVPDDETFRIYNFGKGRHPFYYIDASVIEVDTTNNIVVFDKDISGLFKAGNNDRYYLGRIWVGPIRFWVFLQIMLRESNDLQTYDMLPTRTYGSVLTAHSPNPSPPDAATAGTTWNETDFSDDKNYLNSRSLKPEDSGTSLETEKDYGFGKFDVEEMKGGYVNEFIAESGKYNKVELSKMVKADDIEPEDTFSLLYVPSVSTLDHVTTIQSTEGTNKPFLLSIFEDELPEKPILEVEPSDVDPMYPMFSWNTADDDLWYGLLHFDTQVANNQYHNAVAHLPLNEGSVSGTDIKNYDYVADTTGNATITDPPTVTYEGLAGYALDFSNTADRLTFTTANNPTTHATYMLHVVPIGGVGNLLTDSSNTAIEIESLTNWQIQATVKPTGGTAVVLKSSSLLPNKVPASVIVTVDTKLKANNVKLFINGKLEDQSGISTASGDSEHWKTDTDITGAGTYSIGNDGASNSAICKLEEIVIYNTTLYPVVPQNGEFTLLKNFKELADDTTGSSLSYSARLFIKDYHNIRGKTTSEVATSSPVSLRKAAPKIVGGN